MAWVNTTQQTSAEGDTSSGVLNDATGEFWYQRTDPESGQTMWRSTSGGMSASDPRGQDTLGGLLSYGNPTVTQGGEGGTTSIYTPNLQSIGGTAMGDFQVKEVGPGQWQALNPQTGQWEQAYHVPESVSGNSTTVVPQSLAANIPGAAVFTNAPANNEGSLFEQMLPMGLAALTTFLTGGAGAGVANSMLGAGALAGAGTGALSAAVTGQNPITGAATGALGNIFNGATGASPDIAATANSTMSPDYMVNTGSQYASNMEEALAAMQQGAQSGQNIANSGLGNQFAQANTGTAISQGSGVVDVVDPYAAYQGGTGAFEDGMGLLDGSAGGGSIFSGVLGGNPAAAGAVGAGAIAAGAAGSGGSATDQALMNGDLAAGGTATGASGSMNSLGQYAGLVGQGAATGAAGVTLQQLLKDPSNTELWKSVLGGTNGSYNLGSAGLAAIAGLLSGNANNTAAGQVQDAANRAAAAADPFSSQRPFYQSELKNMYTDPNYFSNNALLKGANANAVNDTSRAMAAQGYNMSGNVPFAVAQRLQNNNMGFAKDMMQTTGNFAGANIQPSTVAGSIMQGGQAGADATRQNSGTLGNVLGSIFTGGGGSNKGTGQQNQNLSQFLFG